MRLDNLMKIFGIAMLLAGVIGLIGISNAEAPANPCIPPTAVDYSNPACINYYLEINPQMVDFSKLNSIISKLNPDLITKNIGQYGQQTFSGKYLFKTSGNLEDLNGMMKYGDNGVITHKTLGEVNINNFPKDTEFTFSKDKIGVKIPDSSEIDLSKIGNGKIDLEPGKFSAADGANKAQITESGAYIRDGKIYLPKGANAEVNGVGVGNFGPREIEINPLYKSNDINSVSFNQGKLIARSTDASYMLDFKDRRFSIGGNVEAIFEKPNVNDFKDVKNLQSALNELGYRDADGNLLDIDGKIGPKTRNAITEFQKANGLEADGIVGPKTRDALVKSFGDYSKITSNGNKISYFSDSLDQKMMAIKDALGNDVVLGSSGDGHFFVDQSPNAGKYLQRFIYGKDQMPSALSLNGEGKVSEVINNDLASYAQTMSKENFFSSINSLIAEDPNKYGFLIDINNQKAFAGIISAESDFRMLAPSTTLGSLEKFGGTGTGYRDLSGGLAQLPINPDDLKAYAGKGRYIEINYADSKKILLIDDALNDPNFMARAKSAYEDYKLKYNDGLDFNALDPNDNMEVMANFVRYHLDNLNLPATPQNIMGIAGINQGTGFGKGSSWSNSIEYYNNGKRYNGYFD